MRTNLHSLHKILFVLCSVSLLGSLLGSLLAPAPVAADASTEEECAGFLYRSKKNEVPVFDDNDRSSAVIARLSRGEKVCYIGEQGKFVIVDWRERYAKLDEHPRDDEGNLKELAFVRLVDLWPPRNKTQDKASALRRSHGLAAVFERAKLYYYYILSGGVPDDGLAPYRPLQEMVPQGPPDGSSNEVGAEAESSGDSDKKTLEP